MTSGRVVALGLEYEEEKRAGLFTMGILVSTIAMALGSGHVWRFPRVAALIGPTLMASRMKPK